MPNAKEVLEYYQAGQTEQDRRLERAALEYDRREGPELREKAQPAPDLTYEAANVRRLERERRSLTERALALQAELQGVTDRLRKAEVVLLEAVKGS